MATKRYSDFPGFIDPTNPATWKLEVRHPDGAVVQIPADADWIVSSRYGKVFSSVVVNDDGKPAFSRPTYRQAPYTQCPVIAQVNGEYRWGMIVQPRPHSDVPEGFGLEENESVIFMTCPMGFNEAAVVDGTNKLLDDALREVSQEIGKAEAKVVWRAPFGVNSSPSFESTIGQVSLVEIINLRTLIPADYDPEEPILGRYWFTSKQLIELMGKQVFELPDGRKAFLGFGAANSAIFTCLCGYEPLRKEALGF